MADDISYTTEEISHILKVSKLTVYDLIKKGRQWILPMNPISDPNHMRGNFEFEVGASVPKDMLWLLPSMEGPIKAD